MTKQDQIRWECELQYKNIEFAQKRLEEIRKECKHPNTYQGKYSWRVGAIQDGIICSDCGHLVSFIGLSGAMEIVETNVV